MKSVAVALAALIAGCTAPGPAPVKGVPSPRQAPPKILTGETARPATPRIAPSDNGFHTVARGETLYAIAFANNLDHRDLAAWNQIESPDRILAGQTLRLTPPPGAVETQPLVEPPAPGGRPLAEPPLLRSPQGVLLAYSEAAWAQATQTEQPPAPPAVEAKPSAPAVVPASPQPAPQSTAQPADSVESWLWPAEGMLTGRFGASGGKGIDIVGARNAPVKAVAPGKVVYSGSGLRGYGRLLIIKHAGEFLSAYAHNEILLVKEGERVAAGQRIALMGDSDAERVKLHFEIRRYGKPLDPLNYLPERS